MTANTKDISVIAVPAPPPDAAGALLAIGRGPGADDDTRPAGAPAADAGAAFAGAAAADLGAAGPPGFGAFSLTVGEAVCFGGKLMRTVCFF